MTPLDQRIEFHSHTISSDGHLLPAALVYEAAKKGHQAIAITDHVDSSNLEEVLATLNKFIKLQGPSLPIKVIPGVELSYIEPKDLKKYATQAKKLGAKIIIVHGESLSEPAVPKGTNRAALQLKGLVNILAHPGNLSEEEAILAKNNNIYLELSARKSHSQGNKQVVKIGKQFGAKFLVNTDAHSESDLITYEQALEIAKQSGLSAEEAEIAVRINSVELLKQI